MKQTFNERIPLRTPDFPLFVTTDPAKLRCPSLAGDPAVMGEIRGCRIPALLNARLPEGKSVLLAAADIGNEGADWGNLGLAIRRSLDDGKTWELPRTVVRLQAHNAPQSFEDWASPFTIDPVLMQAEDDSIVLVVDMWSESKGYAHQSWMDYLTGYLIADGKRWLALYDGPSGVGQEGVEGRSNAGNGFTVREQGWVYDAAGQRTCYYMPQHHDAQTSYMTMGDLYCAVGGADYLAVPPPLIPLPPDGVRDVYVGNVFMSADKPPFDLDHPVFVSKRRAGPGGVKAGYDTPSEYEIIETEPAPLRCAITMFLWMTKSFDGGMNWTQPVDISWQIKREEDGPFLGVGPGVGLCLSGERHKGRLVLPLYNGGEEDLRASAAYSDDNGATWHRADGDGRIMNRDEVQFAELYDGTILAFGRRAGDWQAGGGPTPVSQSRDGGATWACCPETSLISVRCQKSVVAYPFDDGHHPDSPFAYPPGMTPGRQYLLASHPTGRSGFPDCSRTDGAISLGEVQDDHSIQWICSREVAFAGQYDDTQEEKWRRFFAYSCLTILDNGHVGIAYEPQPNNYIAFFEFGLEWLLRMDYNKENQ